MVWPTPYDVKLGEFISMPLPGQQKESAFADNAIDHIVQLNLKEQPGCQRLTNLMVSIGKSNGTVDMILQLLAAGMNLALLNVNYASMEDNIEYIRRTREAVKRYSAIVGRMYPLPIAIRLTGRQIRTGRISIMYKEYVELREGSTVKITSDEAYRYRCTHELIFVDFINFISEIKNNDFIQIDNDTIFLNVENINVTANTADCKIVRGGLLGSYKDVVVPLAVFQMPNFTEKDKEYINMAIEQKVDIIIASCVNNDDAVIELKHILGESVKKISVFADIETYEGFRNYDRILKVVDGIMLARQKLAYDCTSQKNMIFSQGNMVSRANKANISVFISAQLLSSMRTNRIPLLSEVMDIGDCIIHGADGLVLSGETAIGRHPVEALSLMTITCKESEAVLWTSRIYDNIMESIPTPCDDMTAMAFSAVAASHRMLAAAIVIMTKNVNAAKVVSKFKPRCPIIAVTRYPRIARKLHMYAAIIPIVYEEVPNTDWSYDIEKRVTFAIKWAMSEGFVRVGDTYVILSSWRQSSDKTLNMRIEVAN